MTVCRLLFAGTFLSISLTAAVVQGLRHRILRPTMRSTAMQLS